MIIEFFGLPGSGKTCCAQACARKEGLRVVEVENRAAVYLWALVFACVRPALFFAFAKRIIKENKRNVILVRHKLFLLHLHAMAKEGRALFTRGNVILDEGLFQAILSVYEREIGEEEVHVLARHFGKREIRLVYAPAGQREERLRRRARIPRQFLGKTYLGKWFPVLEKNHATLTRHIKTHFLYREIDNG